ncbi:neurotactin-like [Ptychodera flava]|uniref:neurotactin-like n=1 Tax=Ptychodera flava TaxID=63121 RepID=UPI00396A7ED5
MDEVELNVGVRHRFAKDTKVTIMASQEEVLLSQVGSDDESDDMYFIDEHTSKRDKKSCTKAQKYCCYGIWIVIGLCAVVIVLYVAAHTVSRSIIQAQTDCGFVEGDEEKGAYVFKGIPYAVPPVGDLRWREPLSLKGSKSCWEGVYSAKRYGSVCVQPGKDYKDVIGNEDCLYLNVWTPTLNSSASLPVSVFIHGGSLVILSGGEQDYHPTAEMASKGNMVFVSFNYRLNAFGFMALDILSQDSPSNTSGNYGFYDQILLFKWVQNNIHHFGGDANQVTLLGQSSGGTSILAHLVSPLTKGLFHRAWLMSSSTVFNKNLSETSKDNLGFLNNTQCTDVKCLRSLSSDKIANAVPWSEYPYWNDNDLQDLPQKNLLNGAKAVVDGILVPAPPEEMWKRGLGHDVPIVIGSTAQEIDLDPQQSDIREWDWKKYDEVVADKLDTFGKNITKQAKMLYQYVPTMHTPELVYTTMASDVRVTCPTHKLAKTISDALTSPVYRYVATSWPSQPVEITKVHFKPQYGFHGWDCFALFGVHRDLIKAPSANDDKFSALMQEMFFHFAREGAMLPDWKEYPEAIAKLSYNLTVVDRYKKRECEFWTTNGFRPYAWIN